MVTAVLVRRLAGWCFPSQACPGWAISSCKTPLTAESRESPVGRSYRTQISFCVSVRWPPGATVFPTVLEILGTEPFHARMPQTAGVQGCVCLLAEPFHQQPTMTPGAGWARFCHPTS